MNKNLKWLAIAALLACAAPVSADVANDDCGSKDEGDTCETYDGSTGVCVSEDASFLFCDTTPQVDDAGTTPDDEDAGTMPPDDIDDSDDDDGCSVSAVRARSGAGLAALAIGAIAAIALRRRFG